MWLGVKGCVRKAWWAFRFIACSTTITTSTHITLARCDHCCHGGWRALWVVGPKFSSIVLTKWLNWDIWNNWGRLRTQCGPWHELLSSSSVSKPPEATDQVLLKRVEIDRSRGNWLTTLDIGRPSVINSMTTSLEPICIVVGHYAVSVLLQDESVVERTLLILDDWVRKNFPQTATSMHPTILPLDEQILQGFGLAYWTRYCFPNFISGLHFENLCVFMAVLKCSPSLGLTWCHVISVKA